MEQPESSRDTAKKLTITVPAALYARLDAQRDRLNISKLCAGALERELAMIEGQAAPTPAVEKALARLQSAADVAYQRGYLDGGAYAADRASREEMLGFLTWPAEIKGTHVKHEEYGIVVRDAAYQRHGQPQSRTVDGKKVHVPQSEVDDGAYRAGWMTGAKEVAIPVSKAIQVGPTDASAPPTGGVRYRPDVGGPPRAFNNEDAERSSRGEPMPRPVMPPSGVTFSESKENK